MKRPRRIRPFNRVRPQMTEEDQRRQQFITDSKHKLNPYLVAHFNKTEVFTAGNAVTPWDPWLNNPNLSSEAYDEYVSTIGLDNWWKLGDNFAATQTGQNFGSNSTLIQLNGGSYSQQQTPLTNRTYDKYSLKLNAGSTYLQAPISITNSSPFSIHMWFKITSFSGFPKLVRTHLSYEYRGFYSELTSSGNIGISFGDGASGVPDVTNRYTIRTNGNDISLNTIHFVVINCTPSTVPQNNQVEVWVDGTLRPTIYSGGTATTTVWPSGYNMSFGGIDFLGSFDQVGHRFSYLTEYEIQRMLFLGT